MIGEFSLFHWLVVFAIVLVVFGPNKLPELAKAAGKGIRDFKKALNEDESTSENEGVTRLEPQPTLSMISNAQETKRSA